MWARVVLLCLGCVFMCPPRARARANSPGNRRVRRAWWGTTARSTRRRTRRRALLVRSLRGSRTVLIARSRLWWWRVRALLPRRHGQPRDVQRRPIFEQCWAAGTVGLSALRRGYADPLLARTRARALGMHAAHRTRNDVCIVPICALTHAGKYCPFQGMTGVFGNCNSGYYCSGAHTVAARVLACCCCWCYRERARAPHRCIAHGDAVWCRVRRYVPDGPFLPCGFTGCVLRGNLRDGSDRVVCTLALYVCLRPRVGC